MAPLPNLLSLSRLVGAVLLAALALTTGSRGLFLGLLGCLALTDALDGALARRMGATSEAGRKLDSWADHALISAATAGLCLLWPEVVRRERAWFAAGVAAYFAVGVYTLLRWRVVPGYHTRASKATAVTLVPAMALLLAGRAAWPFHLAVGMLAVSGVEALAIALLLPGFSGEVPTVLDAWRRRRRGEAPPGPDAQKLRCSSR